ncbi:MAG: CotH kinase family protein [Saprospiraceae bacterium]
MKKNLLAFIILIISVLQTNAQNFTDSNLPIIIINSDGTIVDEPKVGGNIGIIDNGNGQRNNLTDSYSYEGRIGIELRGQTSQFLFDKKSYGFETWDANDEDLDTTLLDLPKEEDWILYGPYSDKTMIRNVLIYGLSNQIGMYASRTRYCELMIDGEYKGVYVLMEKIKRDGNRVDIKKLNPDEVEVPDISGGYILKLDKFDNSDQNIFSSNYATPNQPLNYQVIYPNANNLQPEQYQYIQDFMNDFEAALSGENYKDTILGYRQYIDVNTFIDFLLLNELGRNPDAYRISTYFHKEHDDDGGLLKMGPIWDFNIGMGNANFCMGSSHEGWVFDYNSVCPDDAWLIGYWWDKLLSDEAFANAVADRWQELRQTTFNITNIHQMIDDHAAILNESQVRNFERFPILGQSVWPNDFVGETYEEEITFLKDWFENRVVWMDENINTIQKEIVRNQEDAFIFYPNPFTDNLNLNMYQVTRGEMILRYYSIMGQQLAAFKITEELDMPHRLQVPTELTNQWSKGVYFYTIEIDGQIVNNGKVVKQ